MSCIRISSSSRERRAPVATGLAFALLVAGCGSPTRPVQPEPAGGGEDAAAAILERGRVAYEAGDSQGARQHYLSLRDTLGHPPADAVLFARLELELGRLEALLEIARGGAGI